ncbi:histidine phosphatase superfamily [Paraphoma chrysanthemicola]|uniref:Histidine phosphatase superfamily n=1 Tax=Paraphoma chrysanthemicola TaxID=798071 RepID=A0A8K0QZN3_9PLEO|nr:histidine phosphatase superfamily [Paraphoma chrysanthemicola]
MSSIESPAVVCVVRHGEALHNVQRGYPHRDPPLTQAGTDATRSIEIPLSPELIIISPMTRTLQSAINMYPTLQNAEDFIAPVQIWPELREANDAICNKGHSRSELQSKFSQFDFSECAEHWDYPDHTPENATARAERVRQRLQALSTTFKVITVISHRGFIAYLVKGRRFNPAEFRLYRFGTDAEAKDENVRRGVHCDSLEHQDFGPTLLVTLDVGARNVLMEKES